MSPCLWIAQRVEESRGDAGGDAASLGEVARVVDPGAEVDALDGVHRVPEHLVRLASAGDPDDAGNGDAPEALELAQEPAVELVVAAHPDLEGQLAGRVGAPCAVDDGRGPAPELARISCAPR